MCWRQAPPMRVKPSGPTPRLGSSRNKRTRNAKTAHLDDSLCQHQLPPPRSSCWAMRKARRQSLQLAVGYVAVVGFALRVSNLALISWSNLQTFFIRLIPISKHQPGEVITLDFRKEKEKLLEKTRADCAAKAWKRLQQGAADGPRTTQTPRLPPPPVSNFASICGKSTV